MISLGVEEVYAVLDFLTVDVSAVYLYAFRDNAVELTYLLFLCARNVLG